MFDEIFDEFDETNVNDKDFMILPFIFLIALFLFLCCHFQTKSFVLRIELYESINLCPN